ncbi:MAG: hypothetical protein M3Z56_09065 [Bacteroidota bacterium]|nr:hypothetical protein [Bacteroidota bacterium]
MSFIYKTLFEVKLIHEYFFTDINGDTIFAQANQSDRMNLLLEEFSGDRQSINDDLLFEFPENLLSTYKNYYLKLLSTYSGFKVAIRVNQKFLSDNTLVYDALHTLPGNFDINILISKKNNLIESYTNSILARPIQSTYFFTNETAGSAKTFPFLTSDVSAFDSSNTTYQQGELASFGINDIREFYKDDTGDQWYPVAGNAFANENDRMLLPAKFYYSFDAALNITDATFTLKDKNGNIIKTITAHNDNFIQNALVDFSDQADVISIPASFGYPDIIFSLEVAATNGFSKTHNLIFSDSFYGRQNWGLINIRPGVMNASFDLFGTDGFLIKRKSAAGVWNEAPIFEIPIKSRFTFWRFKNVKGKELKLSAPLIDYLFKEDNNLLSIIPRSISNSYFKLPKQGSTDTKYFPGPVDFAITKDEKARICFDIMVPESDLFPIV